MKPHIDQALAAIGELRARLHALEQRDREPIAVVGIGCRFPGKANDPKSYWDLLSSGEDAITEIPASRWQVDEWYAEDGGEPGKANTRWGGFIDHPFDFDAGFFQITSREAATIDPQQRVLLEVTWEALADAGLPIPSLAARPVGVYVGIYNDDYRLEAMSEPEAISSYSGTGTISALAANRISYLLDVRGPSLAVNTTCSSSLVAVHLACQAIRTGDCDLAIAAGVNLMLSPLHTVSVSKVVTMAKDGRCKAFDASADGIVRSEGCGVVVLKPLRKAVVDRDRIYAVVRGTAVNQDGRSNGMTAPSAKAQEEVIRAALHRSGIYPGQISYIETHGTGTPLGDPIECEALDRVFPHHYYAGSVKTNLGHLEAAAGIAGFIKAALALHHRSIPPHLHLKKRNPHLLESASRIIFPSEVSPWLSGSPRSAGVSAFSLGGTNAHIVLQEHPVADIEQMEEIGSQELMLLSAASDVALRERCEQFEKLLRSATPQEFKNICHASRSRSTHYEHRLALLAGNANEASASLWAWLSNGVTTSLWTDVSTHAPLAFVVDGDEGQSIAQELWEWGVEPEGQIKWTSEAAKEMLSSGYRRFVDLTSCGVSAAIEVEAFRCNGHIEVIPHGSSLQQILARLYVSGSDIRWCRSNSRQMISLPVYPWQRQTYTLPQVSVNAIAGKRLSSAVLTFEKTWSKSDIEVHTHEVLGQAVVRVSTLLATIAELTYPDSGFSMRDVVFLKLLDLRPGDRTQIVLDESEGGVHFRWFRWRSSDLGWQVHASGRIWCEGPDKRSDPASVESLLRRSIETAAASMPTANRWVPFSIERIVIDSVPSLDAMSVDVIKSGQRSLDIRVCTSTGMVCASIDGLSFVEDIRHQLDLYQVKWRAIAELEPATIYERAAEDLNALCRSYWETASLKLQEKPAIGRRERLYRRMTEILQTEAQRSVPNTDYLRHAYPAIVDEIQLLERCGSQLAEIISGEMNPSAVLFSDDIAECVYRDSPFARQYHPFVVEAIESRLQKGQKIRILEVGGGTGGVTSAILQALDHRIEEYVFTDISPAFIRRTQEKFSEYDQLRFEQFDFNRSPSSQGFAGREFDFIVASNSLHVAADISQTLAWLRSIGNCLVLLEGTGNRLWADLTFGLTQGWSEHSSKPLLTPAEWRTFLTNAGWPSPVIVEGPGEKAAVIVAGGSVHSWWGVVADPSTQDQLIRSFERFGQTAAILQSEDDLSHEVAQRGCPARGILFCTGGELESLRRWVRIVASNETKLFVATCNAQPITESVTNPEQAMLWGFSQVLQREHPDLFGGIVDVDDDAFANGDVVSWILQQRKSSAAALRGSTVYQASVERASVEESGKLTFDPHGGYLITGGLGGVGRHVAEWLATHGAKFIVFASRKGPDDSNATKLLARLAELGSKAIVISCDVSNRIDVEMLLGRFGRDLPSLYGIFHAAGEICDRTILQSSPDDLETVLKAKVHGARWLHKYSREHQPKHFVLFSSAVTLFGMAGLAGYTAANAYLDALASYRCGLGLPATSISWGGWNQTGMYAAVGERRNREWESMGLFAASPQQCLAVLQQALTARVIHAVAVDVDWRRGIPSFVQPPQVAKIPPPILVKAASTTHSRDSIRSITMRHLHALLADPHIDEIDSETSLIDLGLDSVSSVELRNLLATELNLKLPATLIFDYPTLGALINYLVELSGELAAENTFQRLVADIDQMSAVESKQLLAVLSQVNK